jgi:ribose 5-phosphate isomerase B
VVLCGTGIGASIAANKVPGAYCALVTNAYQAERATLSNNANLIALGAQVTGDKVARMLVKTYMAHSFQKGSRSEPKVQRIYEYEQQYTK